MPEPSHGAGRVMQRVAGMASDQSASPIHIVFGVDAAFVPWAGVMLASVLRFDHGARLHIHALSDGVEAASFGPIMAMAAAAGALFSVHDVGHFCTTRADGLPRPERIARVSYARLFIADFLPAEVGRAIYLDVDILCRTSLRALWTFDMAGAVAAVVRDCAGVQDAVGHLVGQATTIRAYHAQRAALPADGTYFNTGVMLIDVAQWRRERIGDRALDWKERHPDRQETADQHALNAVLHGRVAYLHDAWNVLGLFAWQEPEATVRLFHFAGAGKPWHIDYTGYGAAEWRAVQAASPFRDVPLVARADPAGDDANLRRLRIRGVPAGAARSAAGAIIGNVGVARPAPGRLDLFLYRGEAALPAGAYTVELVMAAFEHVAGTAGGRRVRFQVGVGRIVLATLELAVAPGLAMRNMPVTIGFVLPGPARILTCWLSAPAGVRAVSRLDVTLTRLPEAVQTAAAA